jgi:transcriptional regulator NrdR family protein
VRATTEELATLLRSEVIKRDVLEGERALAAEKAIRRGTRRRLREKAVSAEQVDDLERSAVGQVAPVAPVHTAAASGGATPPATQRHS